MNRSRGTRRPHPTLVVGLVVALLVAVLSACTDSSDPSDPPDGEPTSGLVPRADGVPAVTEESVVAGLASVGVAVVDPESGEQVEEVTGEPSPVTVRADELPALVAGIQTLTGLTAEQLDGLAGWPALEGPVGQLTPSLMLAGWLAGATTPASDLGREWMGGQDVREPSSLVVPAGVLDLFLSDVLPRPSEGVSPNASPAAYVGTTSSQSVCEQFQSFVADSINKVFDAIGRLPNVSGDSIFIDILNGVIDLLNLGKDALRYFVINGTKVLLKPVVDAVAAVAGVVALATFAVKTVLPWTGEIQPEPGAPTLGTAPVEGKWTLTVKSPGPQEWPAQVAGCASAAGVTLPSLKPSEADVAWQVVSQRPKILVTPGAADPKLSADGTATMAYLTTVEPPEIASGEAQYDGTVRVQATVHRTDLGRFSDTLLKLFVGYLPAFLPELVKETIANLLRPILTEALDKLGSIRDLAVLGFLFPIYHEKDDETPSPSPSPSDEDGTPSPTPSELPPGEAFCRGFIKMLEYRESQGTGGLDKQVARRQVKMLRAILPLGTPQQAADGEVLAIIWQMWVDVDPTSPTQNPGAIGQAMIDLGYIEAGGRIAKSCKISLDRIGVG
ncbi:hypothetical protein [Nocardioides dilutus]